MTCMKCDRELSQDDIGAHKRLVSRAAAAYMCRYCLADYFGCDVARIEAQIRRFRANGCTLFSPLSEDEKNAP